MSYNDVYQQNRKIIHNVYTFAKMMPEINYVPADIFKKSRIFTAIACGVPDSTVSRICYEMKGMTEIVPPLHTFKSSRKKGTGKKITTEEDAHAMDVVRRIVHDFYNCGKYPTPNAVLEISRNRIPMLKTLPQMQKILKRMHFSLEKCQDGRSFLVESDDVVALRCKFLRNMVLLRERNDPRPVVYVGETRIDQFLLAKSMSALALDEFNATWPRRISAGKGGQLVVFCAGTETGFISGSKLVLNDKHVPDLGDTFKKWFINLTSKLPQLSVIVMDNSSHLGIVEAVEETGPQRNWTREDLQRWLTQKGIEFDPVETLAELRLRAKTYMPPRKEYELDVIATGHGHQLIRMPSNHWQYDPVQRLFTDVKRRVVLAHDRDYRFENIGTFKMAEIEELTNGVMDKLTTECWKNAVVRSVAVQEQDYRNEIARLVTLEPMVMSIMTDFNSFCSSSDEDDYDDSTVSTYYS